MSLKTRLKKLEASTAASRTGGPKLFVQAMHALSDGR